MPAQKVLKKLHQAGFQEMHQRGSHLYLQHTDGMRLVTVPVHGKKDIPLGTLRAIVLHQAGLSIDEFNAL